MPIEESVLEVLGQDQIQSINFVWESYAITPDMYERVARNIRSGRILVHGGSGSIPSYYSADDSLTYTFEEADNWAERAAVVHEATHAACDLAEYRGMNTGDSECMAYLAQCVAGRLLCSDPSVDILVGSDDETEDQANAIFTHGWTLAAVVQSSPGYRFDGDLASEFRRDVASHPWYGPHMTESAGFRGVLRPSRASMEHVARITEHIRPRASGARPSCARAYGASSIE